MNKYYTDFTESIKKYQKSEKYKVYRRKYEAKYREKNKLNVNITSWRTMVRKRGERVTPQKEIDYLLKRML